MAQENGEWVMPIWIPQNVGLLIPHATIASQPHVYDSI